MITKKINTIEEFVKEFNKEEHKHSTLYINGFLSRGSEIMIINDTLCVIYNKKFVTDKLKLNSIKNLYFVNIEYVMNKNSIEEIITKYFYKVVD